MKTYGIGSENDEFIFDGIKLLNSCEEKVLGVIIENKLKFDPHIRSLRKIAAQKLGMLSIISLVDPGNKKLVFIAVINLILASCNLVRLIWWFSFRRSNNSINRIHESSLRTVYMMQVAHFKNLCNVKVVNNMCLLIMKTFFEKNNCRVWP